MRGWPSRFRIFLPIILGLLMAGTGKPVYSYLPAGGEPVFKHISQEDGLSQNSINDILEDRKGFIWLATQDGLNKYDGYGFTVFRPRPGNSGGISSQYLNCLHEDGNGVIWIGTQMGGLNAFNPLTGDFTVYRHHPGNPHSIAPGNINRIVEDNGGNLWIATTSGLEFFDIQTKRFRHFTANRDNPRGLSHNVVRTLLLDRNERLWVGTMWGLNRYNPEDGTFTRFYHTPGLGYATQTDAVLSLFEDHAGELWVGTAGGLMRLDRQTGEFTLYSHDAGNPSSLNSNVVLEIYEDRRNVLWIGTDKGLEKFDRRSESFSHFLADENNPHSLSSDIILSIYESRSGIFWVGTGGGGLNKFDREGAKFYSYRPNPKGADQLIYCVFEDRGGDIWCGSGRDGIYRYNRGTGQTKHYKNNPADWRSLGYDNVRAITRDRDGILWIGTQGRGLDRFDDIYETFSHYHHDHANPASLSHNAVICLFNDRAGNLWIGTARGLNRLDKGTPSYSFTVYRHNPENPDSLPPVSTFAIAEDHEGYLWLGTDEGLEKLDVASGKFSHYPLNREENNQIRFQGVIDVLEDKEKRLWATTLGSGFYRFDRDTGTFKSYGEKDGLPNNVVYCVLEDENGFLWFSTNNGLSKFNPADGSFKNYNSKDGLQSNEFNIGSCFKSKSGEMFFGGVNGFNSFFPAQFKDNPHIPPVVITDFRVFNRPVPSGPGLCLEKPVCSADQIVLSYKDTVFSLEFVALDYTIPEKNRYAYMLEGFDRDWTMTTAAKRFATYTNLDPGEYVFRVKGSNNDGIWNETGASIKIIIRPPFWKTWWFQILAVFFIAASVTLWYKMRMRELSHRTRLTTELQTAHDAQMSIMPQRDPEVPGFDISGTCVPASEVGGDFFDYLWLCESKRKFGIAIGDVSGKAMKAAMTAVMSNGILFSKADESDSIQDIMTRVNRPIYLKTDRKMFTALCLASLHLKKRELVFTNAGLNHPLIKTGGKVVHLKGKGPKFPLGIRKDNHYEEQVINLKDGDVILFFTDGIPDARNSNGGFYDLPRLERLLEDMETARMSAAEIKAAIIADVMIFSESVPQQDDLTLVVVKTT